MRCSSEACTVSHNIYLRAARIRLFFFHTRTARARDAIRAPAQPDAFRVLPHHIPYGSRRHADRPSIVGRCLKCASPRKAHHRTSPHHLHPRQPCARRRALGRFSKIYFISDTAFFCHHRCAALSPARQHSHSLSSSSLLDLHIEYLSVLPRSRVYASFYASPLPQVHSFPLRDAPLASRPSIPFSRRSNPLSIPVFQTAVSHTFVLFPPNSPLGYTSPAPFIAQLPLCQSTFLRSSSLTMAGVLRVCPGTKKTRIGTEDQIDAELRWHEGDPSKRKVLVYT